MRIKMTNEIVVTINLIGESVFGVCIETLFSRSVIAELVFSSLSSHA